MSSRKAPNYIKGPEFQPKRNLRADVRKDAVSRILDGLPPEQQPQDGKERDKIESAARQLLRSLEVKIRLGTLPGKPDTPETRAAIVLERVLRKGGRQHARGVVVPLENLLKPIGMGMKKKKKAAEDLQQILGHHLDDIDKDRVPDGNKRRRVGAGAGAEVAQIGSRRLSRGSGFDPRSIESIRAGGLELITDLSIRLGSMLRDPSNTANSAGLLFSGIIDHMRRLQHDRAASLKDLEKNKIEYAAGCFFLSAKSESEGSGKVSGWGELSDEEEYESRPLTETDVISQSGSGRQALEIFKRVAELSEEVELNETKLAKKQKKSPKKSEKKVNMGNSGSNGRKLDSSQETTFSPSKRFQQWKASVLSQAKASARDAIHEEKGTALERISDDEVLERAAMNALRRHGFSASADTS